MRSNYFWLTICFSPLLLLPFFGLALLKKIFERKVTPFILEHTEKKKIITPFLGVLLKIFFSNSFLFNIFAKHFIVFGQIWLRLLSSFIRFFIYKIVYTFRFSFLLKIYFKTLITNVLKWKNSMQYILFLKYICLWYYFIAPF